MPVRFVAVGGIAAHATAIAFSLDNPEAIAANLAAIMWALLVVSMAR